MGFIQKNNFCDKIRLFKGISSFFFFAKITDFPKIHKNEVYALRCIASWRTFFFFRQIISQKNETGGESGRWKVDNVK